MRVITIDPSLIQAEPATPCVLALGFFDGVHRGHQQVITRARAVAAQKQLPLAVMTFDRHVSQVFPMPKSASFRYLTSVTEKARLMAELGVATLYVVKFTPAFAGLAPQEFSDQFLIGLGAQTVVAGFDYTFGRGGKATVADLSRYSRGRFDVAIVDQLQADHLKISSTRIRALIQDGAVARANVLLGHPYTLTLRPCLRNGRDMRTALVQARQQLPAPGSYNVRLVTHSGNCSGLLVVTSTGDLILRTVLPLSTTDLLTVSVLKRQAPAVMHSAGTLVGLA